MNAMFPFGFPWPTAFYLTVYVLTLVLHWIFMHYVLAGSAYILAAQVFPAEDDSPRPIDDLLREWLPLMLSGAITAGIAPLLFVQILYQQQFYSANLLLFHRWMAIVPTLIAGFYLSYLLRTKRLERWPWLIRVVVAGAAFGCFGFVAWSWTENHLLSLNREVWPEHYAAGRLLFQSREILPRLVMWIVMAFPTMAMIVGWQLWYASRSLDAETVGGRQTSALALVGLFLSALAIAAYLFVLPEGRRDVIFSGCSLPYAITGAAAMVLQITAWGVQYKHARLSGVWLGVASLGIALALSGMAVVRETLRIAAIDITSLYQRHASSAEVGGFAVFLAFLVVNLVLITLAIFLVRRGMSP